MCIPTHRVRRSPRVQIPSSIRSFRARISLARHERLHASFGTGIRPPGGSDLAFTNNPALKPEGTVSYDVGIEQRFLSDKVSLDAHGFTIVIRI